LRPKGPFFTLDTLREAFKLEFFAFGVLAEAQREKMILKSVEWRSSHGTDPKFLHEALELLIQIRHMLKYTYVFAFFMDQGSQVLSVKKDLFEYQQANAEGITERLADLLFAPVSQLDADALKNMIRVTNRYVVNLVKSFEELQESPVSSAPTPSQKNPNLKASNLKVSTQVKRPTFGLRNKK